MPQTILVPVLIFFICATAVGKAYAQASAQHCQPKLRALLGWPWCAYPSQTLVIRSQPIGFTKFVTYPTLSRARRQWESFHGFHQDLDPFSSELKPEPQPCCSQAFALWTQTAPLAGPEVTSAPDVLHDGQSARAAAYGSGWNPVSLVWSKPASLEAGLAPVPCSHPAAGTGPVCLGREKCSFVHPWVDGESCCSCMQLSHAWEGLGNVILLLSSYNENKWGLQFKVVTKNLFFPLP